LYDDGALETLTIGDSVADLDFRALGTRDIKVAELLLDDVRLGTSGGVVLRVEVCSCVGRVEVSAHVNPTLVVVYAEGNREVFGVRFEAEDTRRAAVAHGEDFLAVRQVDLSTILNQVRVLVW